MWEFNLQLFGPSNNSQQQNQQANQQIQQNTQAARAAIDAWLKGHPFPLNMGSNPAMPQQMGGSVGGGATFGGPTGGVTQPGQPPNIGNMPGTVAYPQRTGAPMQHNPLASGGSSAPSGPGTGRTPPFVDPHGGSHALVEILRQRGLM